MTTVASPVNALGPRDTQPSEKPSVHPYTCNSCQVAFRNSDLQRSHMRTDWHRYNIKRRVSSLPPISAEAFNEKVLSAQADTKAAADKASFERSCPACKSTYYSQNAYSNHLQSQKHRLRAAELAKDGASTEDGEAASMISTAISLGEPIGTAEERISATQSGAFRRDIDPDAEAEFSKVVNGIKNSSLNDDTLPQRPSRPHHSSSESRIQHPLSPEKNEVTGQTEPKSTAEPEDGANATKCLFCNKTYTDISGNVDHMSRQHGLFVPERDFLVDLEGLLRWLWLRVLDGHECLYCHKTRHSTEAIQDHMRDSGHCKIAFEDEEDMILVGQFYDFRSTYSDEEASNDDEEREDEDWESASDVSSDDANDQVVQKVPKLRRRRRDSSQENPDQAYVVDEELYLPSGKIAGHRSLRKFFRQNLHHYPSPSELAERRLLTNGGDSNDDRFTPGALVSQRNGGQGMLGVTDAKKREVLAKEHRDQKQAQRKENQYRWGLEKRGNQQKHFRDPLLQ